MPKGTLFASVRITRERPGEPFVVEVDEDPLTRKGYMSYDDALFQAIRILTSYASSHMRGILLGPARRGVNADE